MRWTSILFILLLSFSSCSNGGKISLTHFAANVMTINYHIIVGQHLQGLEKNKLQRLIDDTFEEINTIYNKWNPHSELSYLNHLKKGEKVRISSKLEDFLERTGELVKLTEGLFDPTIEPLQELWKQKLEAGTVPHPNEIDRIVPCIGWDKIHLDNGMFYKEHDLTQLDLGGIAKGYCVDLLIERINALGYEDVFVEWGGEIRCSGEHPDKRPWTIFISRLGDRNPQHALATLPLKNQAIATSGDYYQQWTIRDVSGETKVYTHIFHPKSMRPLECHEKSVASASVLANDCAFADGLATAAMLWSSLQEAQDWAERIQEKEPSVQFWISAQTSS